MNTDTVMVGSSRRRDRVIAASGVLIEWYDFIVYALLITTLQKVYFPVSDSKVGLILAFATFAVGYLARPLGGLVLGRLGDLRGRKFALGLSTTLMLVPLLVVTVLPTYAQIGIWAPLVLTLMRILQGFSVGGQFTGALTTLSESADPHRRSRAVATGLATATGGILVASIVVLITTSIAGAEGLAAGAWRIPVAIGLLACVLAVIAQRQLSETHQFEIARAEGTLGSPFRQILREYRTPFIFIVVLTSWSGVTIYTLVTWLPSYLESVVGASDLVAQGGTALASAVYIVAIIPAASLSDRWGRRRIMMVISAGYLILAVPLALLLNTDAIWAIALAIVTLALMQVLLDSSATAEVTILVPASVRYTAMGVGYSIGAMVGSLAPALEESAVASTGNTLVPGLILIVITALTLPFIIALPRLRHYGASELPL